MATTKRTARKTARTVRQDRTQGGTHCSQDRTQGGKRCQQDGAHLARQDARWHALPARQDARWRAPLARQDARWRALLAKQRERLLPNPSSSLSEEPRPYPPGFFFVVGNCGQLAWARQKLKHA